MGLKFTVALLFAASLLTGATALLVTDADYTHSAGAAGPSPVTAGTDDIIWPAQPA